MPATARTARCNVGVAAVCPSVISRAKPSSSRSSGRGAPGGGRQCPRRAADLHEDVACGEILRQPGRAPGGQVGLAREVQVERLEPPRRLQQQRRRIAPKTRAEGDLSAQQVDQGALELVERPRLGRGDQPERRVELAGLEARLRRGQGALRPPRRVLRQRDRAPQERRRGGEPAARLRPAGRALELRATSSSGPAAAAARCHARRSGSVSRSVASASARCTARRSSAAADRYIAERTSGWRNVTRSPIASNPSASAASASAGPMPEPLGRAPQQQRIADRFRRRDQQQSPPVIGEQLEPPHEALLDPARSAPARPAARTRRRAASRSVHAAARATPAGSPASRRRSGPGPAHPI